MSLLPYWFLYILSDITYFFLYFIFGYRKKVVRINLKNSFPEKNESELRSIEKKFYRHLSDTFVESLKMFSISEKQAIERLEISNPELCNKYFAEGRNLVIIGTHYNNWEMYVLRCAVLHDHDLMAFYTPLTDKFLNKKLNQSRSKFGLKMKSKKDYKKVFETNAGKPFGIIFALDQSPSKDSGIWTTFLNQETSIPYGAEKLAIERNLPVVYGKLDKKKRGHYIVTYVLVEENPKEKEKGYISVQSTKELEKQILEHPEYWLWSHRRWKHKRPENAKLHS